MANMLTRPIATPAERISAATYLWGHTASGPATDRRFLANDFANLNANGQMVLGSGTASETTGTANMATRAAAIVKPWTSSAWGIGFGSFTGSIMYMQGMDLTGTSVRTLTLNPFGGSIGIGTTSPLYKFHSNLGGDGVAAIFSGITKGVRVNHTASDTRLEGVSHDGASFQPLVVGGLSVSMAESGSVTFNFTGGHLLPSTDNTRNLGSASFRMSTIYAGTGTINTSDERAKTEIGDVPEEWLDAWGDVKWQRFKFVDGNRWHVGLIAQSVHAAFAGHGLDAFDIGLCCYDEWEEDRAPIFETVTKKRLITIVEQEAAGEDENGEPLFKMREVEVEEEYQEEVDTGKTRVTLEAGNRWGLRYDECQAIEAAWQRRELSRMAARLAALEGV